MGLRGGEPAAGRPGLRGRHGGQRPPVGRAGGRPGTGQRDPAQRRAALRRPRPSRILHAGGHQPARRGDLGQGGGAGDGRGRGAGRRRAGVLAHPALQEQHRQQGRVLRHARELPDVPADRLRRDRPAPHAVLHLPAGRHRRRSGGPGTGRARDRLPDLPAGRLLRGRGRSGDDPQAADHQHPRRAARRPREIPPAARHHRRRQPVGDRHLPQGRYDVPGAGHDRGPLAGRERRRPDRGLSGGLAARGLPRPLTAAPADAARRAPAHRCAAADGIPRAVPQARRGPAGLRRRRPDDRCAQPLGVGARAARDRSDVAVA